MDIIGLSNPWQAGRNSSGARISIINRVGNGEDVLKRALARVPAEGDGEAHFRFGGPSSFTLTQPDAKSNPGTTVTWPDDGNQDDEPKDIHIIEFDEVSRCWETIRVENPDDAEQYVMVRNTTRIVFLGRDDQQYRAFNLAKADEYK
ncbi:hypothetical protein [Mesorhizobium ciceri]|uniref:hypothetical protein n=1 Tax=Mesorhizobium TaxID=68287 RepID=UPI0004786D36|nr:hypothetical protein [Mesorhizobium ciceri]